MKKEIITKLKKYENFLTYKGGSLIDRSEYELTATNQSAVIMSPVVNFVKQVKLSLRHKLSKNKTHKKDVLFLAYTHSHVNTLAPIVKRMKNNFLVVKRDGFTGNVAKKLKNNNIKYNDFEGYLTKDSLKNIRKVRKLFKAKYKELLKTGGFDNQNLSYLFLIYFPEMIRYIEIINNMLSVEKPKLLVLMNEINAIGNIAVHVAKQKGIKTLCIQHGAMADVLGFTPVSADKIAVWGGKSRKALIKKFVPKDKIVITGAPQFDNSSKFNVKITKSIAREIGLDLSKKYVLFTTQNIPLIEETVKHLCIAVKSIPGLQLVIKTHPAEYSTKDYEKIIKESGVHGILTKKYLYPLIKGCSAMITVSSTTGLETLIIGKPLITINLSGKPDAMPYAESGAAIGVYNPEDIAPAIKSILENQDVRKELSKKVKLFVYDQCYKMDGKASARISNLIKKITSHL